jgi:urease accessory protein
MSSALQLVHAAIASPDERLPAIPLSVPRMTLAKRLWRGAADDGREFGFELTQPLRHGDTFFEDQRARYVIRQLEETLLEIPLTLAPSAAAGIAWAIGNLHLELSAEANRLLAPDEPAVRQLLARLKVNYETTTAVFRPGHFARGTASAHELGASHRH